MSTNHDGTDGLMLWMQLAMSASLCPQTSLSRTKAVWWMRFQVYVRNVRRSPLSSRAVLEKRSFELGDTACMAGDSL